MATAKQPVKEQIEEMIRLATKNGLRQAAEWAERRLDEALDLSNTYYGRHPRNDRRF